MAIKLTKELLVECARAQRLPIQMLQQAGDEFLEFLSDDFQNNGGWLGTNVWECVDLGERFKVQIGLSALVWPDGRSRLRSEARTDELVSMDFKFTRLMIPKEALDEKSVKSLELKARACECGQKLGCWLEAGPQALLQFSLEPIAVDTQRGKTVKLFGVNIYMEDLTFRVAGQTFAEARIKTNTTPSVDLISEVYGGAVERPMPVPEMQEEEVEEIPF